MQLSTQHVLGAVAGLALGGLAAGAVAQRTIARLSIDPVYGVLSRAGAERQLRRWSQPVDVIYLDIDEMTRLNKELGHAEIDRRIRAALQVRRGDVLLLCRYYSGDELLALVPPGDGPGMAERLRGDLAAVGLSATIAVAPAATLDRAITQAQRQIEQAKLAGARGRVLLAEYAPLPATGAGAAGGTL